MCISRNFQNCSSFQSMLNDKVKDQFTCSYNYDVQQAGKEDQAVII